MIQSDIKKYAPGIFSFLVVLLGAVQPLVTSGVWSLTVGLQLAVLVATSITTFIVPLLPGGWRGGFKTGLEIVGVAATAVIPFVINGRISHEQLLLVAVAVIKALATEFGVQIRTVLPELLDAGTTVDGAAVVTGLPDLTPPATIAAAIDAQSDTVGSGETAGTQPTA